MLRRATAVLQQKAGHPSRTAMIGLQVLFPDSVPTSLTAEALAQHLHTYDPLLSTAVLRTAPDADGAGLTGIVTWPAALLSPASPSSSANATPAQHRVDVIVRHDCPLPPTVAEQCITYSLYPDIVKQRMAGARSAAYLSYRGTEAVSPREQYVAVAAVAGALCEAGDACGLLNVSARTSAPATLFSKAFIEQKCGCTGSALDFFRSLPLTTFCIGFQPYQREDSCGPVRYGFRTHGAELLGLPNLATYAQDAASSEVVFYVFHAMWELMERRGRPLVAGEPVQLTPDASTSVAVRTPLSTEAYLQHPPQSVLVLEPTKGWEAFQALTRGGASS